MKKRFNLRYQSMASAILSFLCFFCNNLEVHSQALDIQWGQAQPLPSKSEEIIKIVGEVPAGYIALQGKTSLFSMSGNNALAILDKDKMRILKSVPMDLKYEKEELTFQDIAMLDGQLYAFLSFYNAKKDKAFLFARNIDSETLKFKGEYLKLGEVSQQNAMNLSLFSVSLSPDKSRLLVMSHLFFQRKENKLVRLWVFDNHLAGLWQKEATLSYQAEHLTLLQSLVDNEGNAYISTKYYQKETSYHAFAFRQKGNDFSDQEIAVKDKLVRANWMSILPNGDMQFAGLYADEKKEGVKGAFSFRQNPAKKNQDKLDIKPFDAGLLTSDLSEKKQAKAAAKGNEDEYCLNDYVARQLVSRPGGGSVLVTEQYYVERQDRAGTSMSYNTEHYGPLLVVAIDSNGQIGWAQKIDKHQAWMTSYTLCTTPDALNFIYANAANESVVEHALYLTSINNKGQMEKHTLLEGIRKKTEMDFKANISVQMPNDEVLLFFSKRKEYVIGKLRLK